ncbi:hypothetical protein CH063_06933, partial [Colletotrichum higginsianum]
MGRSTANGVLNLHSSLLITFHHNLVVPRLLALERAGKRVRQSVRSDLFHLVLDVRDGGLVCGDGLGGQDFLNVSVLAVDPL